MALLLLVSSSYPSFCARLPQGKREKRKTMYIVVKKERKGERKKKGDERERDERGEEGERSSDFSSLLVFVTKADGKARERALPSLSFSLSFGAAKEM